MLINKKKIKKYKGMNKLRYITVKNNIREAHWFVFQLLQSINYQAPQGNIQYETPGGDGGLSINTGRKFETITLSGKILNKYHSSYNYLSKKINMSLKENLIDIQEELKELKENAIPVTLISKIGLYNKEWIITDFNSTLAEFPDTLNFTLTLEEYRQANIKTTSVNLVNNKNKKDFLSRLNIALQNS